MKLVKLSTQVFVAPDSIMVIVPWSEDFLKSNHKIDNLEFVKKPRSVIITKSDSYIASCYSLKRINKILDDAILERETD